MKTIAERAREYAKNEDLVQGTDGFEYCIRDYIKGATDQKAIDIETACKAYENELRRLRRILDDSVGVPANLMSVEESLSRIRMEMISSIG